ncbi:MAG: metalloregulator ArsR/SmtB family transcription factor [Chitinophagales bacterium]|nr:metalloregulator ArsR/SmtB family transcription factor [Chitinophagales bacterium]MDW8427048.1 metalloregulator ArsR/SmtB family transcription factor [Chitinophagales bacterium]
MALKLDYKTARQGYLKLRALAHPLRIKFLKFIDSRKECNVNAIHRTLRLEQSVTSQHLKILRDADLVKFRRDGKRVLYRVNYPKVQKMMACAEQL